MATITEIVATITEIVATINPEGQIKFSSALAPVNICIIGLKYLSENEQNLNVCQNPKV